MRPRCVSRFFHEFIPGPMHSDILAAELEEWAIATGILLAVAVFACAIVTSLALGLLQAGNGEEKGILEFGRLKSNLSWRTRGQVCLATFDIHLGAFGYLMIRKLVGLGNSCGAKAA